MSAAGADSRVRGPINQVAEGLTTGRAPPMAEYLFSSPNGHSIRTSQPSNLTFRRRDAVRWTLGQPARLTRRRRVAAIALIQLRRARDADSVLRARRRCRPACDRSGTMAETGAKEELAEQAEGAP